MYVFVAATIAAVVYGADPEIKATDVVAGYRQNFAEFRTLHIQWTRVLTNAENFFSRLEVQAADLEAQSGGDGVTPEEKARLLAQAQNDRVMAAEPKNRAPKALRQDFWTDGIGFQMRIPAPDLGDATSNWRFRPSVPNLGAAELVRDYMDTLIICFNGSVEDGFRVWSARRKGDVYAGAIQSSPPNSEDTHFPPVGFVKPEWGMYWHPFDDFFAAPEDQLHVVAEEEFAGRRTIVVERVTENPRKELRLTPEHLKKFGDKVRIFDVVRAWIDPDRGYVPLKMEWGGYSTYKGKRLTPKRMFPSFKTIDDVEIQSVRGTNGYYPVRCAMHLYAVNARFRGPFFTLGDLIEGKQLVDDATASLDQ
ncbi:MAG: hypothetical protein ACREHD_02365, partial [Pirellulales bacterium]